MKPLDFIIPVEPCSASRPRVSRQGHAYYAKPYKEFKKAAEAAILKAMQDMGRDEDDLIEAPMQVIITIVAKLPKKTKLPMPKPDVDNYAKAVMDAATGLVWVDDWLVQSLTVIKEWQDTPNESGYIRLEVMDAST